MRLFLLYFLSFVLLDALVPSGCRSGQNRPNVYYEDISCDESIIALKLSYESLHSKSDRWSVYVSADSAELCYFLAPDSLVFREMKPMSPEQFAALKDTVNDLGLYCEEYNGSPSFVRQAGKSTDLILYSSQYHSGYFASYSEDEERRTGFLGDDEALRHIFTQFFPDYFEGDVFLK